MTNNDFNLAGALETLRKTNRAALERLLVESAAVGSVPAVAALLKAGADVNVKEGDGITPLHFAAFNGHTAIAEQLIADGAEVDVKDCYGRTPLHLAASKGHSGLAE